MSALERFAVAVLALVLLAIGATLGVRWYGSHQFQAGHAAAEQEQRAREAVATLARTQENAVKAAAQGAINLTITESKHEELAPVREHIISERVRVGPALCGGSTPAAETASAQSGHGADSAGGLVRSDIDRDIRALKLRVEEAFATGRACQAWAVANGMAPPQPMAPSSAAQSLSAATSSGENVTSEK